MEKGIDRLAELRHVSRTSACGSREVSKSAAPKANVCSSMPVHEAVWLQIAAGTTPKLACPHSPRPLDWCLGRNVRFAG